MPEITEERLKELEENANRAKALLSKIERLENESKDFKSRAQQAEAKISEAEKAKLEEQGKLEELLKAEREEKAKLSQTLKDRTNGVLREKLRAEVATYAKDAHNIERVLGVTEHKSLLSIDEENLSVSGAEDFVKKVRETDPYLFKKKALGVTEEVPPNLKDDFKSDEEKYLQELKACNTRKELEAVKRKYNKVD
jgi:hypothetical protein